MASCLLLAYLSPYISPAKFWPIAFFGLATPYLLLVNLFFAILWLMVKNKRFILSVLILLAGYQSIPNYIQLKGTKADKTDSFKFMSFNVRLFDLYMWTKEKTTRSQIFDFIEKEDPDILCIQEFYHSDNDEKYEFKTLDSLIEILSAKNYHLHYTTSLRESDHWGIVTFSKYPIVNKGVVSFAEKGDNVCIYTDIVKDGDTIRLYNAHLASIRLEKHDYKVMQEINKNDYSKDLKEEFNMLWKIKSGFQIRALQADSIRKSIQESPYPTIFCGDFNDTPASYALQTVKGNLKDAFLESGKGLGRTYIGDFPSFRIDYILYDDNFTASGYKTHGVKLSDHHPISTYFKYHPNKNANQ